MNSFQHGVAVITGAASGIGHGLAERCAVEGINVVLADIEPDPLEELAGSLRAAGVEALVVKTDVSQESDVQALADQTFAYFGRVHLLFNNAGVSIVRKPLWESTQADWEWVFGVNFWGVLYGIRAFVPRMVEQTDKSHIVNTGSIAGLVSNPGLGVYQASKFGVVSLSETLALDLAERAPNIKVSVLCPGGVTTRISEAERNRPKALHNPGSLPGTYATRPAARPPDMMSPLEIADIVFQAIRQDRMYILTHPRRDVVIRARTEAILTGKPSERDSAET